VHLAEFPLYVGIFYYAASHYGVRGAALAWLGRGIVDFLCMAILLRIQRNDGTLGTPPELVAAIVSLSILLLAVVPKLDAILLASGICGLTFIWTWRMVLDPAARVQVIRALVGWWNPRPAEQY
jgi:hypothetical protein